MKPLQTVWPRTTTLVESDHRSPGNRGLSKLPCLLSTC